MVKFSAQNAIDWNDGCTCLLFLGQLNTNRNNLICAELSKKAIKSAGIVILVGIFWQQTLQMLMSFS